MNVYEKLARFYDLEHVDLTADVVFYLHLARQAEGPVLEVGCGTGRLLLPLVQAGLEVTGLDNSPAMLARARRKLGDRVTLIKGDMRTHALPGQYRLIIISINTFLHLTTMDDQLQTLHNLGGHLAPGGCLVIDLPAGDELAHQDPDARLTLERIFQEPETGHPIMKLVASRIDWMAQLQEVTYVYEELLDDGQVRRTVASMTLRHVFRYELELLLATAGYHLKTLYGDYDLSPYGVGPRMIAVAER
jgi:SAM-dependent methyltransferase